jgi:hypothetical protein
MENWAMVPTLSASTIRGLVLVPAMIIMQRFGVVAWRQQQQPHGYTWVDWAKEKGVNLDEA